MPRKPARTAGIPLAHALFPTAVCSMAARDPERAARAGRACTAPRPRLVHARARRGHASGPSGCRRSSRRSGLPLPEGAVIVVRCMGYFYALLYGNARHLVLLASPRGLRRSGDYSFAAGAARWGSLGLHRGPGTSGERGDKRHPCARIWPVALDELTGDAGCGAMEYAARGTGARAFRSSCRSRRIQVAARLDGRRIGLFSSGSH